MHRDSRSSDRTSAGTSSRRRSASRSLALATSAVFVALVVIGSPSFALPPEEEELAETTPAVVDVPLEDPHDPSRAMHPLRVAAYAAHPVGVALDWILVRPAVWVVRREPFRTIFGYED
jgi:hypothetical protein